MLPGFRWRNDEAKSASHDLTQVHTRKREARELTRLREEVAVEAEVVGRVLVALQLLALQHLEELDHHEPAHGGRGGGDGGDDLSGDHLDLVTGRLLNPEKRT